jgi:hypothetical protein
MSLQVDDNVSFGELQLRHLRGETLTPVLLLGEDAAYVWIPKNGSTTLKAAWLHLQGSAPCADDFEIHGAALKFTLWLTPDELRAIAVQRKLMAIWRDPIDRFVSACCSHLVELTTGRFHQKLLSLAGGDSDAYQASINFHDQLFLQQGVQTFADDVSPSEAMNSVALQLRAWIQCHPDWSHHTIPQVCFLGGDPSFYSSILGMEQIDAVLNHWSVASGRNVDRKLRHVSSTLAIADPWRRLERSDLTPEAIEALEHFYAADWAFITLAHQLLGEWSAA